ncbi:hypothetical protein chiPu_0025612, partial [Chiloscyllium punctatum]|nr:hypothetical protein [Chiloscyllium punctatum]
MCPPRQPPIALALAKSGKFKRFNGKFWNVVRDVVRAECGREGNGNQLQAHSVRAVTPGEMAGLRE